MSLWGGDFNMVNDERLDRYPLKWQQLLQACVMWFLLSYLSNLMTPSGLNIHTPSVAFLVQTRCDGQVKNRLLVIFSLWDGPCLCQQLLSQITLLYWILNTLKNLSGCFQKRVCCGNKGAENSSLVYINANHLKWEFINCIVWDFNTLKWFCFKLLIIHWQ